MLLEKAFLRGTSIRHYSCVTRIQFSLEVLSIHLSVLL